MISDIFRSIALAAMACCATATAQPFVDITQSSGVGFVHENGATGRWLFPEMMGAGVGLLDFDLDGDLDLYLVQGGSLGDGDLQGNERRSDRLYRNDLKGFVPHFVDVSDQVGLDATGYGMGVATGDYDGDGDLDLFLANFGANELWRNDRGRFVKVTPPAWADHNDWSIGGSFLDFDSDGRLDLYVVNYVEFDLEDPKVCRARDDRPDYCSPQSVPATPDRLYRNLGEGKFEEVTQRAGVKQAAPGLGVVAADFNRDLRPDLYVANDGEPNFLWLNRGGSFIESALMAGAAVNLSGLAEASMGVDAADFDRDGDLDLFMTHLNRQTNTLYRNDGRGNFSDISGTTVLGASSFSSTGFGTAFIDLENDGDLDLFSANGAVVRVADQDPAQGLPLRERNQLWRQLENGHFEEISAASGQPFAREAISRGAAVGDINNDGLIDLVLTNNGSRPEVLLNRASSAGHWLGLRLIDSAERPVAAGAAVALATSDGHALQPVRTDGSYASARDPRVVFGLGENRQRQSVDILWPDGQTERFVDLEVDRYHDIQQNTGK